MRELALKKRTSKRSERVHENRDLRVTRIPVPTRKIDKMKRKIKPELKVEKGD